MNLTNREAPLDVPQPSGPLDLRPSWMDAPVAVSASVMQDLRARVRSLENDNFPMSRKELLLFLDTVRGVKGSL